MEVRVYHNGDDAFIAWRPKGAIDRCLGFALFRRRNGVEETVDTWVGFEGQTHEKGEHRPSTEWPIQRYQWTDFMAEPGDTLQYRVVPMVGDSYERMRRDTARASTWTPEITLDHQVAPHIQAYFNRGIVASQWVSRRLDVGDDDALAQKKLKTVIDTPGDPMRAFLMGDLGARLTKLLEDAAKNKADVYAALYEFGDHELETLLTTLGPSHAHVLLANGSPKRPAKTAEQKQKEKETGKKIPVPRGDQMKADRPRLTTEFEVFDRILPYGTLGHNKFLVVTDRGKPRWVWTGSTNWTRTGLCTQANNALLIDDAELAEDYLAQWKALRDAKGDTPAELKKANGAERAVTIGATPASLWFTPMKGQADLAEARAVIEGAQQSILFLMFNPGPSSETLLGKILETANGLPREMPLYIRGALNQDPSVKGNRVALFEQLDQRVADYEVVLPAAVDTATAWFRRELKKFSEGIAMVHSKVVVVDAFGDHPVVMTGSHNLGPKASESNDENLLIIRDAPGLASAYATNIMAVYNQYNWRFNSSHKAKATTSYNGLRKNPTWQPWLWKASSPDPVKKAEQQRRIDEKFFEMGFWVGAG